MPSGNLVNFFPFRCVTGTPIEKSLDDLYGLLLFLQCDPYSVRHWFRRCLYEPYLRGEKVIHIEMAKKFVRGCVNPHYVGL